jgi:MoaA/NifB/PqqE/SkfB family radical SAM enzyme
VSWIITHACQERCGYCISPEKEEELTSEEDHFAIQNKMLEDGLTKNRYIGGEPLLIPHLPKLIADAHSKSVNTRLSTNGILLTKEMFDLLKPSLNSIALPFESIDDVLNEKIRGISGKRHREIVSEKIRMIKEAGNIGILVNTCVNKENIDGLEALGGFLNDQEIDHWKLRRFNSTSGRGAIVNKNRFDITDDEFHEKVRKLQEMYPNLKIDGRMPSKLASRLMVSPQGDLYRMIGGDDEKVHYGNLLRDNLNVKEIAQKDKCD